MTLPCEQQVTVIIPHISTRKNELMRAVSSVDTQTHQARGIVIATDNHRDGSAITRNRALYHLSTRWVAFLDDDDWWYPQHLEVLTRAAIENQATVVYSGCDAFDHNMEMIPRREEWGRFGEPFDSDLLRQRSYIPVTSLVYSDFAQKALFGAPEGSDYDDWGFYLRLLDLGAKFHHVPEVTWAWHHHGANTSGRVDRW